MVHLFFFSLSAETNLTTSEESRDTSVVESQFGKILFYEGRITSTSLLFV